MKRFVGKIIGTILGFLLGGPPGAFLGFVIGHLNDTASLRASRQQGNVLEGDLFPDFQMNRHQKSVFAISVIVLGAKLAKVDGHVTRDEVLAFRRAFRTRDNQLNEVGRLFDEARASPNGYEPYAARLAQVFYGQNDILEEILAGLFYIAIADSTRLSRAELVFLRRVAVIFGFHESDFVRVAGRVGLRLTSTPPAPKHDTAYDVLGLPTNATDKDIKRTYRTLIRKHHPDKLMAEGVAPEIVADATEKMKRINAAYADICRIRNIK